MLKHLDLFSGIGGFTLGLQGISTPVAFCEIEPYCQQVLRKHWKDIPIHDDIRRLTRDHINGAIDIVCGGFPCQDISVAGYQAGLGGTRSGLWWEMHRLITEINPRWVLVENVPALKTKGADAVLSSLEEVGYTCWPTVVGAWAVGAPHNRERVWILGYSEHDGRIAAALSRSNEANVFDAPQRQEQAEQSEGASTPRMLPIEAVADTSSTRPQGRVSGWADTQRESIAGHTGCGSASLSNRWTSMLGEPQYDWEQPRTTRLEPRLGGAGDGVSSRAHRLTALGNSVVPQVVTLFGEAILAIENSLDK